MRVLRRILRHELRPRGLARSGLAEVWRACATWWTATVARCARTARTTACGAGVISSLRG